MVIGKLLNKLICGSIAAILVLIVGLSASAQIVDAEKEIVEETIEEKIARIRAANLAHQADYYEPDKNTQIVTVTAELLYLPDGTQAVSITTEVSPDGAPVVGLLVEVPPPPSCDFFQTILSWFSNDKC